MSLYPEDIHPDKKGEQMFKHLDEYVRAEVINALNLMYKDESVEVVLKLMNHSRRQVFSSCARIIHQLNETGTMYFKYGHSYDYQKDTATTVTILVYLVSTIK
jgi:hypothetical protein